MRVDTTSVRAGVGDRPARLIARWSLVTLALIAVLTALIGLAFAGSSVRIAEGVHIAGVDVSGLTKKEARTLLERRFDRVARVPVVFTAGGEEYPIKATTLGVEADWATAVESAAREGEGFGPVRGFKRLQTRFFGSEIAPPVQAYEAALDFKLAGLARAIDQRHVEAKLVRRGLAVETVPGQSGRRLARDAAAARIVRALARLERGQPIALPVRLDPVDVTEADLAPAAAQARTALSAPVRLEYEGTRWKLPRWRIAELLSLPVAGTTDVAIAGPGAEAWFAKLRKTVERPPADATFRPVGDGIEIVPAKDGLAVDVPATAKALLAAAVSTGERSATLVVRTAEAELTTAEAQAMGIERRLASYTTLYAGTPDRITNLQLGVAPAQRRAHRPGRHVLLQRPCRRAHDRARLPAGARDHQGRVRRGRRRRRLAGRDDRLQRRVGGGAEDRRAQPALALHQPLPARPRRDRQLSGPRPQVRQRHAEVDLRRRRVGRSRHHGLDLRGGPERRVESGTGSIRETGPAPIRRVKDPTLLKGETTVEEEGSPARATAVTRKVYDEEGTLLHDETWNTSYRGEYRIIRVGTKPPPKPQDEAEGRDAGAAADADRARYDSAVATASTNHCGSRIGRCVTRSTIACDVDPSATTSPSRSTTYS